MGGGREIWESYEFSTRKQNTFVSAPHWWPDAQTKAANCGPCVRNECLFLSLPFLQNTGQNDMKFEGFSRTYLVWVDEEPLWNPGLGINTRIRHYDSHWHYLPWPPRPRQPLRVPSIKPFEICWSPWSGLSNYDHSPLASHRDGFFGWKRGHVTIVLTQISNWGEMLSPSSSPFSVSVVVAGRIVQHSTRWALLLFEQGTA